MNQRIQILRALAIIAVVVIHTPAPEPYVLFIRPFFNFAVAMFLFLSAYLTADKASRTPEPDYRALIKGRLRRLLPTYAAWVIIAALPALLHQLLHRELTGLSCSVTLLSMSVGVPYYFYLVYIQLLLLHPWLARLAASRWWSAGLVVTPLALVGHYWFNLSGLTLPSMLAGVPFPSWFAYYYLGILLGQRRCTSAQNCLPLMLAYAAALLLQIGEAWLWYTEGHFHLATTQTKFSSFLSSSIACLLAGTWLTRAESPAAHGLAWRSLVFIGNCSMGIFLCHCTMIYVWKKAAELLHLPTPYPTNTVAVLAASLLLILAANRLLPPACVRLLGLGCGRREEKRRFAS